MSRSIEFQNFLAHYSQLSRDEQTKVISELTQLRKKQKFVIKCKLREEEMAKVIGSAMANGIQYETSITGDRVKFIFESPSDRNTILLDSAWSEG